MLELHTNAPTHWPRLRIPRFATEAEGRELFLEGLQAALEPAGSYVSEMNQAVLVEGGALEVPIQVRGRDGAFAVFFYPQADEAAAAHFFALLALAERNPGFRPLFYSPASLLEIYPEEVPALPGRERLFLRRLEKAPVGQYAIWWGEGEGLEGSRTAELLDRVFARVDGFEGLLAAQILHELGLPQDDRVELPQSMLSISVLGPERLPMIVSFSAERGVRFHFHTAQTTPLQRDRFLEHLLAYADENLPSLYFADGADAAGPALRWWRSVRSRMGAITLIDVRQTQGTRKTEPQTAQVVLGAMHR
ncbi:MAG: hypothetical protein SFU83_11315 [Meiothermus sp.]|nr:hypothetical protein [Meiothermus sp.]